MKKVRLLLFYIWVAINFIVVGFLFFGINMMLIAIGCGPWYGSLPIFGKYILFIHGIHVTITGRFPPTGNYVVIANHGSYLDIFLLAVVMGGRKCSGCAAAYLFWIPLLNLILLAFNVIPIFRNLQGRARKGIERAKRIMEEKGFDLVIMPEGTRTPTGELLVFKKGAFYLALGVGRDFIPIYIIGAYEAAPKHSLEFNWNDIHMHIGDPIPVPKNTPDEEIYTRVQELHARVSEIFRKQWEKQKQLHPVYS